MVKESQTFLVAVAKGFWVDGQEGGGPRCSPWDEATDRVPGITAQQAAPGNKTQSWSSARSGRETGAVGNEASMFSAEQGNALQTRGTSPLPLTHFRFR